MPQVFGVFGKEGGFKMGRNGQGCGQDNRNPCCLRATQAGGQCAAAHARPRRFPACKHAPSMPADVAAGIIAVVWAAFGKHMPVALHAQGRVHGAGGHVMAHQPVSGQSVLRPHGTAEACIHAEPIPITHKADDHHSHAQRACPQPPSTLPASPAATAPATPQLRACATPHTTTCSASQRPFGLVGQLF